MHPTMSASCVCHDTEEPTARTCRTSRRCGPRKGSRPCRGTPTSLAYACLGRHVSLPKMGLQLLGETAGTQQATTLLPSYAPNASQTGPRRQETESSALFAQRRALRRCCSWPRFSLQSWSSHISCRTISTAQRRWCQIAIKSRVPPPPPPPPPHPPPLPPECPSTPSPFASSPATFKSQVC